MRFVIIDESTAAGNLPQFGGPITPVLLQQIATALETYMDRDVATYWGGSYAVRAGTDSKDVRTGEIVAALLDTLPNAPGAVAYHDVAGHEVPVIFLARMACAALMMGSSSVSSALAHEFAETAGDPACNLWADDGRGSEFAHELCDACQEWGYDINGVAVSDFVLPAFFAPGSLAPFNYLATIGGSALSAPLATGAGGYQLKRSGAGGETQVFGQIAAHRRAKKAHWSSRTYRRGARVSP